MKPSRVCDFIDVRDIEEKVQLPLWLAFRGNQLCLVCLFEHQPLDPRGTIVNEFYNSGGLMEFTKEGPERKGFETWLQSPTVLT